MSSKTRRVAGTLRNLMLSVHQVTPTRKLKLLIVREISARTRRLNVSYMARTERFRIPIAMEKILVHQKIRRCNLLMISKKFKRESGAR